MSEINRKLFCLHQMWESGRGFFVPGVTNILVVVSTMSFSKKFSHLVFKLPMLIAWHKRQEERDTKEQKVKSTDNYKILSYGFKTDDLMWAEIQV